MKNNLLALATILTFTFFSNNANAQTVTATQNATASATIVAPITISKNASDLKFGEITSGATAGTILLTPLALATASGGVGLVAGTTPTVPEYTVNGQDGKAFTITLPAADLTLTGGTGTEVKIGTFTASTNLTTTTIATGGTKFTVGATLSVGASQPAGAYSVTFPVTVNYN